MKQRSVDMTDVTFTHLITTHYKAYGFKLYNLYHVSSFEVATWRKMKKDNILRIKAPENMVLSIIS